MTAAAKERPPIDDPRQWVLSHWDLINRLARRRFYNEVVAEEAALYVMDRLSADNWRCLRDYAGRARLSTYVSSVVYRQLEDFARTRFGRVRPPAWLTRLGPVWLLLFRLICLERYPYAEALIIAETHYPHMDPDRLEAYAEKIVGAIPTCGAVQHDEQSYDETMARPDESDNRSEQQEMLEQRERALLFEALSCELFDTRARQHHVHALANLLRARIRLEPQERLLLKLHHQDGLSVTKAGEMLGLNRFQAHGKLRRVYARIKSEFEKLGLNEELRQLIES